ncbi:MAG: hypothetical protein KC478_01650 [Bacteriovoracaceae bacterium]|nr:hypothetical protein [Bacteriovoracaceae bacterium]
MPIYAKMGVLKLLLFTALFLNNLWAQDTLTKETLSAAKSVNLDSAQLAFLKNELAIQSIFIEGVKSIQIETGGSFNSTKAVSQMKTLLDKAMQLKTQSLPPKIQDAARSALDTGFNERAAKSVLSKTKEFFYKQKATHTVKLASVVRRFGFDVGLVYFLSLQVDLTFPSIMMALGHIEFAPLLAMPISSMATGGYAAVKAFSKTRQLTKNLGGKVNVKQRNMVFKMVEDFFRGKILPKYELININLADKNYTLSVERRSLLSRIKQKLGWNKHLNYQNLVTVMQEEDLVDKAAKTIINSDAADEIKLVKILNQFEMGTNDKALTVLKSRFGDYIHEMHDLPDFAQGKLWVGKISHAQSFEEFGKLMMVIPDDIPPRVFERLWREKIIPSAANSIGPFMNMNAFKTFNNFRDLWDKKMRRTLTESVDITLNSTLRASLGDFILEAMQPVNGCTMFYQKRGSHSPLL